MSLNSVMISGNLTRDPETRTTANGYTIIDFSVAVNDRVKENGEWTDRPNFIDCTLFGKQAESLAKYLHKGMRVSVLGKLRQERWTDKNGNNRSAIKVVATQVEMPPKGHQTDSEGQYDAVVDEDPYGEEIPF